MKRGDGAEGQRKAEGKWKIAVETGAGTYITTKQQERRSSLLQYITGSADKTLVFWLRLKISYRAFRNAGIIDGDF